MKKVLAIFSAFIFLLIGCGANDESTQAEEELSPIENAVVNAEKEQVEDFDPDSYKDAEYDAIRRNPDEYYNKKTYFVAEVFQVVSEGEEYNEYLMDIKSESSLNLAYVIIEKERLLDRLLEDDFVQLFGKPMNEMSYETTGGSSSTVPIMYADFIFLRD